MDASIRRFAGRRRVRTSWWLCGSAALLLLLCPVPAEAAVRQIVLLQSFDRGNLVLDRFTANLRSLIDQRSPEPVTFIEFVVNPAGFKRTPEQAFIDFLQSSFAGRPAPDLVITLGGPAAAFARAHRAELFPGVKFLFAAVDQRFLRTALPPTDTAVAVANSPTTIISEILQLLPGTTNLFIVIGSGELGRFWRREFEAEAAPFQDRVKFIWSDGMPYAQVLRQASTLPPRTAILFSSFDVDGEGATYATTRVLSDLRAQATAPLFASQGPEIGYGTIGGTLISVDTLSHTTADVVLRILAGAPPASITTPIQHPGPPTFDWRELQRWGISERRLPANSVILFREPGVWERFKWAIVAGASALVAQTVLIAALLVNRAKRRRAEQSVRESEARFRATLSSLNRRLVQAQEQERTRVARDLHDDVCQRMAILAIDLLRLRQGIPESDEGTRGQVNELYGEVQGLTAHVNRIAHQLHSSKLKLLGLTAAASTFCREVASHHGVDVRFTHEDVPRDLPESVATSVFRVLQEALSNAVKYSGARRVDVALRATGDRLLLDVRDEGKGFDVEAAIATSGLGLVSMQERIRLVDGDVAIESGPGAGTTVRASVPLPAAAPAGNEPVANAV